MKTKEENRGKEEELPKKKELLSDEELLEVAAGYADSGYYCFQGCLRREETTYQGCQKRCDYYL